MTVMFSHHNEQTFILMMYSFLLYTTRFFPIVTVLCFLPCPLSSSLPRRTLQGKRISGLWPFSEPLSIIKDLNWPTSLHEQYSRELVITSSLQEPQSHAESWIWKALHAVYCVLHTVLCVQYILSEPTFHMSKNITICI